MIIDIRMENIGTDEVTDKVLDLLNTVSDLCDATLMNLANNESFLAVSDMFDNDADTIVDGVRDVLVKEFPSVEVTLEDEDEDE